MKIIKAIITLTAVMLTILPLAANGQEIIPGKWELDGKAVQQEIKSKDHFGKLARGEKKAGNRRDRVQDIFFF